MDTRTETVPRLIVKTRLVEHVSRALFENDQFSGEMLRSKNAELFNFYRISRLGRRSPSRVSEKKQEYFIDQVGKNRETVFELVRRENT